MRILIYIYCKLHAIINYTCVIFFYRVTEVHVVDFEMRVSETLSFDIYESYTGLLGGPVLD